MNEVTVCIVAGVLTFVLIVTLAMALYYYCVLVMYMTRTIRTSRTADAHRLRRLTHAAAGGSSSSAAADGTRGADGTSSSAPDVTFVVVQAPDDLISLGSAAARKP